MSLGGIYTGAGERKSLPKNQLTVTAAAGAADKSKKSNDSGDSEFWDEAQIARAITPYSKLRKDVGVEEMFNQVIGRNQDTTEDNEHELPANTGADKREQDLNRRLTKFSEKRQSRVKANKGFFLRDKENNEGNEEEQMLHKDNKTSDKKRFNDKFRESLELYMNPLIHEKDRTRETGSSMGRGAGATTSGGKTGERVGSTDEEGLFRCLKCKKATGYEKRFTSFFERNLHMSITHHENEVLEVTCTSANCGKQFDLWNYPAHVESKHNQTVMMDCPVGCCEGIDIKSLEQVWSHAVKTGGAVKYVCPICLHDCFFLNSNQLSKHLNDQHNITKVNICVLCSVRRPPKIPSSRLRASVHTAKCLICAKTGHTGLTPNYLLENAMAHLQEFHSHTGYLCINCMTIRHVNDVDHYEKCLNATNEGMLRSKYKNDFIKNSIIDSFESAIEVSDNKTQGEPIVEAEERTMREVKIATVPVLEDVEDQMEWRNIVQQSTTSKSKSSYDQRQ